jgi:hypothetical protein
MGCEVRDISLPNTDYAIAAYYVICTAEASAIWRASTACVTGIVPRRRALGDLSDMYRNTRGEGFGAEVKRRIMLGTYVLSHGYYDAYYLKAQKVRADCAGFYECVSAGGRGGGAGVALSGVSDWRESERSRIDVFVGYLHDYRQSGGNPVHERALRHDWRCGLPGGIADFVQPF